MKLSVIIVNYNVKYFLEQCLRSVLKASEYIDTEIFVVDNNSSDNSIPYLTNLFPEITFITNKNNPGFSKANNQAIELAKGEYILLLNPDTVIGEHSLFNVCRFMDEHPIAGALGVKMIDGCGNFLPESKRGFPSPWNSFCKISGLSKLFPKSSLFAKYHLRYLNENEIHEVDVLAGAFMLLRKTVLDKIGLLDDSFFMYGEDIDLSYRITSGGYKNYYFPEPIIHYKGESTKKDVRYVKTFYQAMIIFFQKHYPGYQKLYAGFIYMAIYSTAGISALNKLIHLPRKQKISPKLNHSVFSTDDMTYEEIIRSLSNNKHKSTIYHIYHPETKILIAAGDVQTNVDKEYNGLS
ncbi:MAG: glycosyltransferase family 2 protein [Candidatus Azobacteroides sp.]|nr:glycosyltransferase family 2 protein [Candidatus Azobacteroides sp.]